METYNFNISLSILNHLGRNLYRNFITVLGEAISNSWDADANNVWIEIDKEKNYFSIRDDGDGMTSSDFQDKFLKIGYSKRKEGKTHTESGRPFIGRKGIGKLALLSCSEKIHIATRAFNEDIEGGVINNADLDKAIDDDLTPQNYKLEELDYSVIEVKDFPKGTILYFENLNEEIKNRIEYLRKLVALYFRFSLIDKKFNIFINNEIITLDELSELSSNTQFVWQINQIKDPYLLEKISSTSPQIKNFKVLDRQFSYSGFIASVTKPSNLNIRATGEKVTIDLYVNGRLREKDILKHMPSARIVESYLYGQIHFDMLDDDRDRFTSSREGVISDDSLFKNLLEEVKSVMTIIIDEWDDLRIKFNQDGDTENTKRLTKKERKSKELFGAVADEYAPPKGSDSRSLVDNWINFLSEEAQFNFSAYADCFISENLHRNYIHHKKIPLSTEAQSEIEKYKNKESDSMNKANISIKIRGKDDNLSYLSMDYLSNLVDKPTDPNKEAALARDAKEYKPIRDAMAHTAILTANAKNRLGITFENIRARLKILLGESL